MYDAIKGGMTGNTLQVPGATLYYKLRGSGPLLLVLPGGDGDADVSDGVTEYLTERYSVLTYDRRGLSRSRVADHEATLRLSTHSEDVHHLLAAVTSQPAIVVANSGGALIGLDLVARHPDQVRRLIAHEPPLYQLLPPDQRATLLKALEKVQEAFRTEGVMPAMQRFAVVAGLDLTDIEPDARLPGFDPQREANLRFLFQHDEPAVRMYTPDLDALKQAADRIIPAAGENTRGTWIHTVAESLADHLGKALVEFPGGHPALVFRPRAFAKRLHEVFADYQ
jgi:pimeloyl-ACP methyl ester carboxylesterase